LIVVDEHTLEPAHGQAGIVLKTGHTTHLGHIEEPVEQDGDDGNDGQQERTPLDLYSNHHMLTVDTSASVGWHGTSGKRLSHFGFDTFFYSNLYKK
jgi:hypothetical protein